MYRVLLPYNYHGLALGSVQTPLKGERDGQLRKTAKAGQHVTYITRTADATRPTPDYGTTHGSRCCTFSQPVT